MQEFNYSRKVAARNPMLAPITRNWNRWKRVYETFLSRELGSNWASSRDLYADDSFGRCTTAFAPVVRDEMEARIELEIYASQAGYRLQVTGKKMGRVIAADMVRFEDIDTIRDPNKCISNEFLTKVKASLGGSFEQELKLIRETATNLLLRAQQCVETAEDIADLVQHDPLKNAGAIREAVRS